MSSRQPLRALVAAALLALAFAVLPTLAAAEVPSTNLLQNPSAEEGNCAEEPTRVPHWESSTGMSEFCYSGGRTLDPSAEQLVEGQVGTAYFAGGQTEISEATQSVDVSPYATDIDTGQISAVLSGWLGGFGSQEDNMKVTAAFYDGEGHQLGTPVVIGPVTAAERNAESTLVPQHASGSVPSGTRSILVTMTATRFEGSDNDGAADLLRLSLQRPGPRVATEEATGVTATSAVVHGSVSPEEGFSAVYFQVGKTTSYGIYTDTQVFQDSQSHSVQAQLYGLEPSTTYHYRLVGEDRQGKRYGEDRTFTTPFAVTSPQLFSAFTGTVGPYSATVLASVDPRGTPATVSALSPGSSLPFFGETKLPGDFAVHSVEIPVHNLKPGTTYHYYVSAGNGQYGSYIGLPPPGTLTATTASTNPGGLVLKPGGLQASLTCLTAHSCLGTISIATGRLPLLGGKKAGKHAGKLAVGKFKLHGGKHGHVLLHWTKEGRRIGEKLEGRRVAETVIDRSVHGKRVSMTRLVKVK